MNTFMIMHNMITEDEHGKDLDYTFYELLDVPCVCKEEKIW
jgi:hypothetical protein